MLRYRLGPAIATLLLLGACDADPLTVPTQTAGSFTAATAQEQAPLINELVARPEGTGNMLLAVRATDPANSRLTISWKVDSGSLSASTGPSVLWRTPKQAGTYTATVEVTNDKGIRRSATQQFTVSAEGQAAQTTGTAVVSAAIADASATATGSPLVAGATSTLLVTQSGQFQIPSPLPFATPPALIVAGASAIPGSTPGPVVVASPFQQPVATPIPGPSPTTPPLQPIATPTLTPTPAAPLPSSIPTAVPGTPQPGVPQPPDSVWTQVNPANVPATAFLNALSFPFDATGAFNEGWAVGNSGTVIHTGNSGQSWDIRNTGIPGSLALTEVNFTAGRAGVVTGGGFDQAGFAAGANKVFRTTDYGATWGDISPPTLSVTIKSLVVYNARQVLVVADDGQIFRTDNGNSLTPGGVTWTAVDTKPITRPNDATLSLSAGAAFPAGDMTLGWFMGDNLYAYDADNSPDWRRRLQLLPEDRANGAISMTSVNDIWVGTQAGAVYHSVDAGNSWNRIFPFNNREHNGVRFTITAGAVQDMAFTDAVNGWVLTGINVYDTRNGGASWKETRLPAQLFDIQVESRVNAVSGQREFFGWGVGPSGTVVRYNPAQ